MKGKKLLAGVLSAAMLLGTMAMPAFAAELTVTTAEALGTALNGASDGDVIIIDGKIENVTNEIFKKGAGKNLTIKGNGDETADELVFATGDGIFVPNMGSANITFEGLTMTWGNYIYRGFQHSGNLVYNNCVINGQAFLYGTSEKFTSCIFNQESSDAYNVWTYGAGLSEFSNCTFNSNGKAMLVYNEGYGSTPTVKVEGTTFNAENSVNGKAAIEIDSSLNPNFKITVDSTTANGFAEGSVSGSSLYNVKNMYVKKNDSTGEITVTDNLTLSVGGTNVDLTTAKNNAINVNSVAKIGDTYYGSLESALAAATANDTIKLCNDVTYSKHVSGANRVTNAKALDLNGKTLSLPDDDYNFGAITISNGTIESTKTTMSQGTALIFQYDQDPIIFDGVTINTKDFSTYGYVIGTNGGKCVFKNSKMNVNPTAQKEIASLFSPGDHTSNCNLVIEDSEINVSNASTKIALWGNVEIKGSTKINAALTDNDGIRLNNYGSLKVTATTDAEGNTKAPEINITTTGSNRYGINVADTTPYTVSPGAKVNTSIYREPSTSNVADDEIKLSFEDVTVNEGEKVYDLYVEAANDKTINRLTTADLTFALTNDSANKTPISYEVFGTDKVTVQPDNANSNKFMFYFNGLTAPSGTGVKVKVGQVKFNGYGKFGFKATAGEAHATTVDGENVVTDFVAGTQLTGQGKLNIATELTDVEIKVPTRKLTVKIDFNNSVSAQTAEYTDMTVKVSGLGESYEEKLGDITDNKAEVEVVDVLEKNKTYMVEVSGAGYRTARYTVTMTEDKTLNFWNNAKDSAVNVEEGNSASAKNVTFLAGELVKDGQINIYDLSAVVSYFGTVNNVTGESQYAKYDLNRDGKVDSKDVAYVLVSWGK